VIPQIDESFLDRIVQMTGEGSDQEYRQKMVDDLRGEAMKVVPLEAAARYYRTLLESLRGSLRKPTAEEKQTIEGQVSAILAEAVRTTDQVNEIYTNISKDLNPSTILYSATAPVSFSIQRPLSTEKLLLVGLLLLLVATPLVVIGALLYDRVNREEDSEIGEEALARSELSDTNPTQS